MSRRTHRKQRELYYAELRTAGGVPLFVQPLISRKIIDGLKWSCENRGLRIYDYALLADRIVMIANTAWGNLNEVLESFAGFSSKAVMRILRNGNPKLQTSWMLAVFQEHGPAGMPEGIHIWDAEMMVRNLFRQEEIDELSKKIHRLPVDMGWVREPEHFQNSSASPFNPMDGWIVEATDPWS